MIWAASCWVFTAIYVATMVAVLPDMTSVMTASALWIFVSFTATMKWVFSILTTRLQNSRNQPEPEPEYRTANLKQKPGR